MKKNDLMNIRNLGTLLGVALVALSGNVAAVPAPARVPSFGPNGTHWPSLIPTPFLYDTTVAHRIDAGCSWNAIRGALMMITPTQANQGVIIMVQPGVLNGNGSAASSTPVLQDLGSTSWGKRVTIAPRDGYGTLTISGGARFLRVNGVCFAGLNASSIKLEGCANSALAWTKCNGRLAGYGNRNGNSTEKVEFSEVVQPTSMLSNTDSADFYSNGGPIKNWRFDGCYHAPRFYAVPYTGAKPHTDTIQFATPLGGSVSDITTRDTAYFASNNCSIQTGGVNGFLIDHCYVVAGAVARSRYPFLPGGATEAGWNALNGAGQKIQAVDSIIIGGAAINQGSASRPISSVSNTKTDRVYTNYLQPATGAWTVDTTLDAESSGMPPMPDDAYLSQIWAKDPTSPVIPPVISDEDPEGGGVDEKYPDPEEPAEEVN